MNENPDLFIYGLDYSSTAVSLVKSNPSYDPHHVFSTTWDLSSAEGIPKEVERESVDLVVMIFVWSALHPDEWERAMKNLYEVLLSRSPPLVSSLM